LRELTILLTIVSKLVPSILKIPTIVKLDTTPLLDEIKIVLASGIPIPVVLSTNPINSLDEKLFLVIENNKIVNKNICKNLFIYSP
jgi:hypothetical protein